MLFLLLGQRVNTHAIQRCCMRKPMGFWNIEQCKSLLVDLNNGIMISRNGHDMGPLNQSVQSRGPFTRALCTVLLCICILHKSLYNYMLLCPILSPALRLHTTHLFNHWTFYGHEKKELHSARAFPVHSVTLSHPNECQVYLILCLKLKPLSFKSPCCQLLGTCVEMPVIFFPAVLSSGFHPQ